MPRKDAPKVKRIKRTRPVRGFRCPRCRAETKWACAAGENSRGYVMCTKSPMVSQTLSVASLSDSRAFCTWQGVVERVNTIVVVTEEWEVEHI
jgi:transcription elongation factor Elf1